MNNIFVQCLLAYAFWHICEHLYYDWKRKQYMKNLPDVGVPTADMAMPHGGKSYIKSFIVTNPSDEVETVGEILHLSMFGEYCPNQSLRGYSLTELLANPTHYRPHCIVQKGIELIFHYPVPEPEQNLESWMK